MRWIGAWVALAVASFIPAVSAFSWRFERIDAVDPAKYIADPDRPVFISQHSLSHDGRFAAFVSAASNLAPGDDNDDYDVFLYDHQNRTIGIVSRVVSTVQLPPDAPVGIAKDPSYVLSDDGAEMIVAGTLLSDRAREAFLRGEDTEVEWVSIDTRTRIATHIPVPNAANSRIADLSNDRRYIAFTYLGHEPARYDRHSGTIDSLTDIFPDSNQMTGGFSENGRYACAFDAASGWPILEGNVRDLASMSAPVRFDLSTDGAGLTSRVNGCAVSNDGKHVAYRTAASNVIAWPERGFVEQVYVRRLSDGQVRLASDNTVMGARGCTNPEFVGNETLTFSCDGPNPFGRESPTLFTSHYDLASGARRTQRWRSEVVDEYRTEVRAAAMSANGSVALYEVEMLERDFTSGLSQRSALYRVDASDIGKRISRVSGGPLPSRHPGHLTDRGSYVRCEASRKLSADGRYFLFPSNDQSHFAQPWGQAIQPSVLVMRDMQLDRSALATTLADGSVPQLTSIYDGTMSPNARFVAFAATSNGELLGQPGPIVGPDAYVLDRETGRYTSVSTNAAGGSGGGVGPCLAVSDDGRTVAFTSTSRTLAPGDSNDWADVYLWRADQGRPKLLSKALDGTGAVLGGERPMMSADGSIVVFNAVAPPHLGVSDPRHGTYLYRAATDQVERLSLPDGTPLGASAMSSDGRFLAVTLRGPGDTVSNAVLDLSTGRLDPIVERQGGQQSPVSYGPLDIVGMSRDGRFLVGGPWHGTWLDRVTGATRQLDRDPLNSDYGLMPQISDDGQTMAIVDTVSALQWETPRTGWYVVKPGVLHSNVWWKPDEPGWGIYLMDQGDAMAASWYTNDEDGEPTWFLLSGSNDATGRSIVGEAFRFEGVPFRRQVPNAAERSESFATVRVLLLPDGRLEFGFARPDGFGNPGLVTSTRRLVPFAFGEAEVQCEPSNDNPATGTTNHTDIWYGGPGASGWGVSLVDIGDRLVGAWYTYDDDHEAMFYVLDATKREDSAYTGQAFRPLDGELLDGIGIGDEPVRAGSQAAGAIEFRFSGRDRGEFQYDIDGTRLIRPIERFQFGSTVPGCGLVATDSH